MPRALGVRRWAIKRASGRCSQAGRVMIAGSLNRLRRKGCTASSESGPPRLNRMMAIFISPSSRAKPRDLFYRATARSSADKTGPSTPLRSGRDDGSGSRPRRLPVAHDLDQLRDVLGRGLGHHAMAEIEHVRGVAELVEDACRLALERRAAHHQHHGIEITLQA